MPRPLGFHSVLVPISDRAESERAMDVACRLAADHGAKIAAVAVVEIPPELPIEAHMKVEEAAAHALLRRAAAIAETYGVDVAPLLLRARDAAPAIVVRAVQQRAELIVIGAPRLRRLRRGPAFGSTVEHVLKNAPCRVMVIGAAPDAASLVRTAAA